MISLAPIHKSIRNTLYEKIQSVSRDFTDKSLSTRSDMIQREYTKAVWTKMFSPVDSTEKYVNTGRWVDLDGIPKGGVSERNDKHNFSLYKIEKKEGMKTVTIFGGELDETDNMSHGFGSIYTPRTATKSGKIERTDGLLRPIAGIKDISVNYRGGLSAIREATINWVCWTFQDLERLTPHFMAHGKGVLIEWGYGIPEVKSGSDFGASDMVDGTAYSKIKDRIIELKGNYDAMAGIITSWDWSLRDDGGFDCMTKIVSRGVNILEADISGTGTTPKTKDGERDLTLGEFVKILRENLVGLCSKEDNWYTQMNPTKPPVALSDAHKWAKGEEAGTVPPGILYVKIDGWFSNPLGGPWVTWGFFEDNILSKFVGRYEKDKIGDDGKVTNSFRSIEPILLNSKDAVEVYGGNLAPIIDKETFTSKINEAKFESVKIRNSQWLLTMDFNRWILPGQFPAKHTRTDNNIGKNLKDVVVEVYEATDAQDPPRFLPFAVDESDWNEGGYLRNILISYDLIEKSFENANTVKQGMNNLFNEFNKDTDGFWNFEVVDDPYIPGNVKVIDANKSSFKPKDLIALKLEAEGKEGNDEFGNPESPMFVFPSWGEKSIVKSETLTAKLPSSMAVSAMYAGTAAPERKGDNSSFKTQAVAKLSGGGSDQFDPSQKDIVMPERIGNTKKEVFGSRSPYGHPELNYQFKSDKNEGTTIPSSANMDGGFGPGHGVPFDIVDYEEFLQKISKGGDEATEEDKKAAEEKIKQKEAQSIEADINFHRLHPNGLRSVGGDVLEGASEIETSKKVTGFMRWFFDGHDEEEWSIYLMDGTLTEAPGFGVYMRRSMIDYLHGNGKRQKEEDRLVQSGEPLVPIELEIEIVGIGGIIPGNAFHVDYIPQQYKDYCVFQAISVNHTIAPSGWKTTIKGLPRVALRELIKEELITAK